MSRSPSCPDCVRIVVVVVAVVTMYSKRGRPTCEYNPPLPAQHFLIDFFCTCPLLTLINNKRTVPGPDHRQDTTDKGRGRGHKQHKRQATEYRQRMASDRGARLLRTYYPEERGAHMN